VVEHAKFVNAKPVYFPSAEVTKWSNDDYGNGSYRVAVFHDKDGTVTGVANSYILNTDPADGVAIDKACQVKATWNGAVCKGDYGRISFAAPRPAGGGQGARGQGAGGPGAGGPGGGGPGTGGFNLVRRPAGSRPTQPPVVLSRDGKSFSIDGTTNVRAG